MKNRSGFSLDLACGSDQWTLEPFTFTSLVQVHVIVVGINLLSATVTAITTHVTHTAS